MPSLANTKVVIFGGSTGLGFGVAKAALAEGASVIISSSNNKKLQAAAERLGGGERVGTEVVDLKDEEAIKSFFKRVGKFDHLVLSAGDEIIQKTILFPNLDLKDVRDVYDVRFWGLIALAKHSQGFVTQSLTCTSGTSAMRPAPGWTIVDGVTSSILGATRGLALDLAPIRVNCVAPGLVATEMWDDMNADTRSAMYEQWAQKHPVKHVGTAEEVAEAYLFAMKCSYFTGQTIFVDGGGLIV